MPAKLDRCVKKVMAEQGYSEERAYAICTASLSEKELDNMTTPRKARRAKTQDQQAARRLKDLQHKAALATQAAADAAAALGQVAEPDAEPEMEAKAATEEKCYDCGQPAWKPYGGATSIADALSAMEADKRAWAINDATYLFREVVDNIMGNEAVTDKGQAIAAAAKELQSLLDNPVPLMKAAEETPPDPAPISVDLPETKETLWQKFTGWLTGRKAQSEPTREPASGFKVVQGVDGAPYWFGWVSNKYRDISTKPHPKGEIFTEAAHKEFVAYLDEHPDQAPELWTWHVPGTARTARADWWEYADGFLMMSGPLTPEEAKAFEDGEELGMSHGFYVLDRDAAQGHILKYRTYEVTELLPDAAANPFTNFEVWRKELATMAFSEKQRQLLVKRFGEAKVAELEKDTSAMNKALEQIGWESKAAPEAKDADCVAKKVAEGMSEADAKKACYGDKPAEGEKALEARFKTLEDGLAEIKHILKSQAEQKADAQKALDDKFVALETAVKAATDGVKELQGETPRALRGGYKASEAGPEPPADLKTAAPHPDPLEKHWKAITSAAGPAAGGQ